MKSTRGWTGGGAVAVCLALLATQGLRAGDTSEAEKAYAEASAGLSELLDDPASHLDALAARQAALEKVTAMKPAGELAAKVARDLSLVQAARGLFADAVKSATAALGGEGGDESKAALAQALWGAAERSGDPAVIAAARETIRSKAGETPTAFELQEDPPYLDSVGKAPKALVAKDLKGNVVDLSKMKGKLVMVHFWGMW